MDDKVQFIILEVKKRVVTFDDDGKGCIIEILEMQGGCKRMAHDTKPVPSCA